MKPEGNIPAVKFARQTINYYWQSVRRYKFLLLVNIVATIVAVVLGGIVATYIMAHLLEQLSKLDQGVSSQDLYSIVWFLVFIKLGEFTFWRINDYVSSYRVTKTLRDLERFVFGRLGQHSYRFFAENFAGALVTQNSRFIASYQLLEGLLNFDLLVAFIRLSFSVGVLLFIAPLLGISLLIWAAFFIASVVYLTIKKSPVTRRAAAADSSVTANVADVITNMLNVKVFAREKYEKKRFNDVSEQRAKKRMRSYILDGHIRTFRWILLLGFYFFFAYISVYVVVNDIASVTAVLAAQFYLVGIYSDMFSLNQTIQRMEQAFSDAAEMTEILNLSPGVKDPKNPESLNIKDGLIHFNNVKFRYEEGNNHVLSNFNLTIEAGQKVGLVGHSGSGKSTLSRLLMRFADLQSGTITIDSQDISKLRQNDLRSQVAFVPQEPILFHRSLMDNIRYGRIEATDEEVIAAAKLAHATDFIDQLPDKYETLVGERGVKLSGGEKQRIAIARAMLSRAPILVLDEATSALDSKSEKLITSALDELMKNRTTIVIAHRLSTIRKMDRILVMKSGKIIEDGSHDKLLKQKGVYAELWGHQSGGFLEE